MLCLLPIAFRYSANTLLPGKCLHCTRQENPRSPSILPNGEQQVNRVLTVRFLKLQERQIIKFQLDSLAFFYFHQIMGVSADCLSASCVTLCLLHM